MTVNGPDADAKYVSALSKRYSLSVMRANLAMLRLHTYSAS